MKNKISNRFLAGILLAAVLFAFSLDAYGQNTAVKNETSQTASKSAVAIQDLKLESRLMARAMPYRVILPARYDFNKSERFPVVYLLHGLTGHFDNWADKTKLKDFASGYQYIVVMPEGENGWYTDSATAPNDKYESYIARELVAEIDKKFRTIPDKNRRAIAGLSMGGYGSLKFGLKYPEMFSLVGSFSGALQAASFTDKMLGNNWKVLTDSIMSVYAAEGSQTRRENDIYKIVREMPAEKIKNLPFIYLDCGTEDGLIASNREFSALLLERKIPHEFRQLPGRHDWVFWNSQIREFFDLSERFLQPAPAKAD